MNYSSFLSIISGLIQGLATLLALFLSLQFVLFQVSPYYSLKVHKKYYRLTLFLSLFTLLILAGVSWFSVSISSKFWMKFLIILSLVPFLGTIYMFILFVKSLDIDETLNKITGNLEKLKKSENFLRERREELTEEFKKTLNTLVDLAIYALMHGDFSKFEKLHNKILEILSEYPEEIDEDICSDLIRLSYHIVQEGVFEKIEDISLLLRTTWDSSKFTLRYHVDTVKFLLGNNQTQKLGISYFETINDILGKTLKKNKENIDVLRNIIVNLVELYAFGKVVGVDRRILHKLLLKIAKAILAMENIVEDSKLKEKLDKNETKRIKKHLINNFFNQITQNTTKLDKEKIKYLKKEIFKIVDDS